MLAASRVGRAAAGVASSAPGFLLRLPSAASLLAPLVLLLAALAVAQPAAAQTSITLVSNNGKTFTGQSSSFTHDAATSFTTGASGEGYTLTGLTLYMRKSTATFTESYTVTVNANDSGRPGTILATLSTTDSIPVSTTTHGALRFSGIVNLAANSTYWVVLDANSFLDSRTTRISGTASDDEDSGALPGWSIGDVQLRRISDQITVDGWGSEVTAALRMNLRGYGKDTTAPVLQSARVSSDGTKLTLYYDEELDPNSAPAHGRFSTNVGGEGQALPRDDGTQREAPVTVSGSTVTMDLVVDSNNAVTAGQAVAMGYNPVAETANPLRNLAGLKAATVSGLAVANDSGATVPTVDSVTTTA